jgi:hypothetical protein
MTSKGATSTLNGVGAAGAPRSPARRGLVTRRRTKWWEMLDFAMRLDRSGWRVTAVHRARLAAGVQCGSDVSGRRINEVQR